MNKLGALYLAVWKRMFSDLLGWSDQETLVWARRYEDFLQDPDDMVFHADPPYWTWHALVPEAVDQGLWPDQRCRLRNEILAVFPTELYLASYLDVDWKQYKNSINLIVGNYAT